MEEADEDWMVVRTKGHKTVVVVELVS